MIHLLSKEVSMREKHFLSVKILVTSAVLSSKAEVLLMWIHCHCLWVLYFIMKFLVFFLVL